MLATLLPPPAADAWQHAQTRYAHWCSAEPEARYASKRGLPSVLVRYYRYCCAVPTMQQPAPLGLSSFVWQTCFLRTLSAAYWC